MERFNAHIGSANPSLQQAPEILKAIGMNLTVDIFDSVIDHLMSIIGCKAVVGQQEVGIERGASFDMLADFRLQDGLLTARYYDSANLSAALQYSHDRNLVFGSGASNAALALAEVHVAGLAADEGFVYFNTKAAGAAHLQDGAALHRLANPVEHEPSGFLSDTQRAGDLARANAVLCAADQPASGEPLIKSQRGVLKDGAHLRSELPLGVGTLALPLFLIRQPSHIGAATGGASDPIGPAVSDHIADAVIGIGEVNHCFLEGAWRFHVSRIGNLT